MKKEELRTAIQEMNTYQFGQKKELTNKLSKVTSYVAKQEVLDMVSKLDKQIEEVKPTLPVIPQFVDKWLKKRKKDFKTVHDAILYIHSYGWDDETHIEFKLYKWIPDNVETFARAWLDGYTIEKEKMYHVLDQNRKVMIRKYRGVVERVNATMSPSDYPHWQKEKLELTEQEIKDYDERYWAFAEEVPNE